MKRLKITTSDDTMHTRFLVGEEMGICYARPARLYCAEVVGEPIAEYLVEHETMFFGDQNEWTLDLSSRVEDAHSELVS